MPDEQIITPKPYHIFLALPAGGDYSVILPMLESVQFHGVPAGHRLSIGPRGSSALPHNFNELWCQALNGRETHGVTHFAMLHSDTWVEPGWLGKLLAILQGRPEPLVSVVSPIKSDHGLTCVALDTDYWAPRKLSMNEIMDLPPTFGQEAITTEVLGDPIGKLLVGAGAWLADIRPRGMPQPDPKDDELLDWAGSCWFEFKDKVHQDKESGLFTSVFANESWNLHRQMAAMGIGVLSTREVELHHYGTQRWVNNRRWGTVKTERKEASDVD